LKSNIIEMLRDTTFDSPASPNSHAATRESTLLDDEMLEITTDARRDISDLVDRSQVKCRDFFIL
jgi:hypothetical protein